MTRKRAQILAGIFTGLFLLDFNSSAQPVNRIKTAIDERRTVRLLGNRHPMARPEFEVGVAAPDLGMERMILALHSDPAQQSALEALIESQHDPSSPEYHRWLTPETFGERFGVSASDVRQVSEWLTGRGFTIDEVPAGGRTIVFSGNARQVEAAFHTSIRLYNVAGNAHYANATDPEIPEALAGVVAGAVTLHNFGRKALHTRVEAAPNFTSGSAHYLAPADFATIYDVAPLYSGGIDGTGQTIAIVGRTNIKISDVQTFRSTFGLPLNNPVVVVNGTDPGIVSTNEASEAYLDVEWSGAVAKMATVKFVVSKSTNTTDGVDLSAQYIVSNNLAAVMSTSFGSCEVQMGSGERTFYSNLWQQAASQGITALISSGDSGAAGCDAPSGTTATGGAAVNGLCSTPYSVCVGGTEFNEAGNNNLYWSASNNASDGSALSYIPEVAWNESGSNSGSGLWATGGGASAFFTKPTWQTGPGVPADGKRDVPDVSLTAAGHDGYLTDILGSFYIVSGTSAASPTFAGLMALVNQKTAARQGNANTTFYALASLAASGGAHIFHGTTGGNNTVPGVTGFSAGPQYNQATGLGSADAFVLVNHWTDSSVSAGPAFTLSVAQPSVTVLQGSQGTVSASVAVSGGFNAAVGLSVSGMPTGVTASFAPTSLPAPGSGAGVLTISAGATVAPGSYSLTVTATSGTQKKTAALTLVVTLPLSLTENASSISIARGASGTITVTTHIGTGFNSAVALSATVPAGVTAAFTPPTIGAPGAGTSQLKLTVGSTATPGTYTVTIKAAAGSLTPTETLSLTIPSPPSFTLTASPSKVGVTQGGSGSTVISLTAINGFNGSVTVSFGTLPAGVTGRWTSVSNGVRLTLTTGTTAKPGSYPITITGTSPGITPSPTVTVTLTIAAAVAGGLNQ
jgi:pseudomonalisin